MYSIFQYSTPDRLHLSWQDETSSSTFLTGGLSDFFSADTWTHCCIVYDGEKVMIYRNGELYTTVNGISNRNNFEYDFPIVGSPIRRLNDVRIYDHTLSPLEVKQISQGLILHYPFNRGGLGQENLLKGSYDLIGGSGTYSSSTFRTSGNMPFYNQDMPEGAPFPKGVRMEYTTARIGFCQDKVPIIEGPLTETVWVKAPAGGTISLQPYWWSGASGFSVVFRTSGEWQKLVATVSTNTKTQDMSIGYVYYTGANEGDVCYVCGLKVEYGEKDTLWCPNSTDDLATKLGINNNIEYDCSGYNHHLTNFQNVTYSNDTPKYFISTELSGTSYGTHDFLYSTDSYQSEATISCWIKRKYSDAVDRCISNSWLKMILYSDFTPRLNWRNSTGSQDTLNTWAPGGAIPLNEWTHICFTIKDGIARYYKNGVLAGTSNRTQYGTLIHGNISNGIGGYSLSSSKNWIGGLSDFRLYCTALSAEDIKSLYQDFAYIDNNGNMYGTLYKEV